MYEIDVKFPLMTTRWQQFLSVIVIECVSHENVSAGYTTAQVYRCTSETLITPFFVTAFSPAFEYQVLT